MAYHFTYFIPFSVPSLESFRSLLVHLLIWLDVLSTLQAHMVMNFPIKQRAYIVFFARWGFRFASRVTCERETSSLELSITIRKTSLLNVAKLFTRIGPLNTGVKLFGLFVIILFELKAYVMLCLDLCLIHT